MKKDIEFWKHHDKYMDYREELLLNELDKYKKVVSDLLEQNAELKAENERLTLLCDTWQVERNLL